MVVYSTPSTNSIDTLDTIKALNGYIDVYLPDFKYFEDKYALKYSKAKNLNPLFHVKHEIKLIHNNNKLSTKNVDNLLKMWITFL